jgi:prephenate dehydratase
MINVLAKKETPTASPVIAIQGFKGSYHDIAARAYFGDDVALNQCDSFDRMFTELEAGQADYGAMAIENSVAGTILPNYALLRESTFRIIGEVNLRIKHQFMALPGQSIPDIREVRSHPMAFLQCLNFLRAHPNMQRVESKDTALSAEEVAAAKVKGVGIIASSLAAQHFGMEILAADIEDNKRNFTRFLILEKKSAFNLENPVSDKASICFHLGHRSGSLAAVLTVLAAYQMNLTKIQSLPLVGKEWEYFFHLDMEFEEYALYQQAMQAIYPMVWQFQVLGEYKKGNIFDI